MGGPHGFDSEEVVEQRRMDDYSVRTRGKYTFDSELKPFDFWKKLRNYLIERDIEVALDERKWRFNFRVEGERNDE